jgi:hypothetical protein
MVIALVFRPNGVAIREAAAINAFLPVFTCCYNVIPLAARI